MARIVGTGRLLALVMALALAACARHEGATEGRAAPLATGGPAHAAQPAPVLRLGVPATGSNRSAPIRLTRAMGEKALQAGVLQIELADGTRYPVRIEGARSEPDGRSWTLTGRVHTQVGAQAAVFTFGPDAVFGVLPRPDGRLLSVTTTRGLVSIGPDGGMVPPGKDAVDHPDFRLPPTAPKPRGAMPVTTTNTTVSPASGQRRMASAAPLAEVQVDLLGLYSDELVALRGSASAAETEVVNQIAISNQAHVDSGSRVRFSLVGLRQVQVPPGSYNSNLLDAMTANTLQGVDVYALRDEFAADLVFLLRPHPENDGTCGIGWLPGSGLARKHASPEYGYSVSNVGPSCGSYVVPHELGHNLGSMHDRETATDYYGVVSYGAYPYSFGYRQQKAPAFATIMAYEAYLVPWVGYFSNPGSTACGASCGIADEADNVRSLNQMAEVIAAYRGPMGTLAIVEAEGVEPISGERSEIVVPIRLYGPAPAGGLAVQVQVVGGTATALADYEALPATSLRIYEGESETSLELPIIGDDAVEGDETIVLRISSADAPITRSDAVVTIVDDDPRLVIEGKVAFPAGSALPAKGWDLMFDGIDGPDGNYRMVTVSPPDFRYAVRVARGSNVTIYPNFPPEPFVSVPVRIGQVKGDVRLDVPVYRGLLVSGRLLVPPGDPVPTDWIPVRVSQSLDTIGPIGTFDFSPVPGESFSTYVMPGALINIDAYPEAPYQPYKYRDPSLQGDLVLDIQLSRLPSLFVWGGDETIEGGGAWSNQSIAPVFSLSAPAPAGGVTVTYSTRSGTAKASEDFVPVTRGTVVIPEGSKGGYGHVDIVGDRRYEHGEYFDVVIDAAAGAEVTVPAMRVRIHDDDARTGGPLAPKKR